MKTISWVIASLFLGVMMTLPSPQAYASGGGGGGDGGGRDPAVPDNPEEKSAPGGFANQNPRSYSVKAQPLTPAEIEALRAQGFVSESEQRESAERHWNDRASDKSKSQWDKYQSTAYDVTAGRTGVSLSDAAAMSAAQPTAQVSQELADEAWSASQQPRSAGVGVTTALGGTFQPDDWFKATRTSTALPNRSAGN